MVNTSDFGMGRLPAHGLGEDKDDQYPLRAVLPFVVEPRQLPNYKYWPYFYDPVNQGNFGTCVGHSSENMLLAGPVIQKKRNENPNAIDIYLEAIKIDEWTENDNGNLYFGTSVRAAMKVLQQFGFIKEYRWAQTMEDVRDFLSLEGPMVVGSNWYSGMFRPDESGFIKPTGTVEGGHAYLLIGRNNTRGVSQIVNSWGPNWGRNGRAWIADEDLEKLVFGEWGEVAAAPEFRKPRFVERMLDKLPF